MSTVTLLPTDALKGRQSNERIVQTLRDALAAGRIKSVLFAYIDTDNVCFFGVSNFALMADEAYMVACLQTRLAEDIGRQKE